MHSDALRERVLLYLYEEMTPEDRAAFERDLAGDPALRAALAEEERFHRVCPVGETPPVSEEVLNESRLLLRMSLRRERESGVSPLSRLVHALRAWMPQIRYDAVVLLLVGLVLGRVIFGPAERMEKAIRPGTVSPVSPDRLEILDLRVTALDPATGRIRLSFHAASRVTVVEGDLKDEAVQGVLAAALRGDVESGARLEAVGLMQGQTASVKVREALVYALSHDENPGVRLKAAEALKDLVNDEQVREALIAALVRDPNPGVRIKAVEALKHASNPAILRVMKKKMAEDENAYIRAEARRAVLRWQGDRTNG